MIKEFGELLRATSALILGSGYWMLYQFTTISNIIAVACGSIIAAILFQRWRFLAVLALLTGSLFAGSYRLAEFPVRVHPDETTGGAKYLEEFKSWFDQNKLSVNILLRDLKKPPFLHHFWVVNPRHDSRPRTTAPLVCHLFYLATKIFGHDYIAYRWSSLMAGALAVLFLFLLLREIFGQFYMAYSGAALMAFSPWFLGLSRIHLPYIHTVAYGLMVLWLFWVALRRPFLFVLVGILLAFSLRLYPPIKVIYFIIPTFMIYLSIFYDQYRRNVMFGLLILTAVIYPSLIVQGPQTPRLLFGYDQSGAEYKFDTAKVGIINTIKEVFNFNWKRYLTFSRRDYIELGLRFNPVIVGLSLAGMLVCLVRFRDPGSAFLLLWMVAALMPDALSLANHVSRRAIMTIAPLMSLAIYPVYWLKNKHVARVVVSLIILGSVVNGYVGYFKMYENLITTNPAYAKMQAEKLEANRE